MKNRSKRLAVLLGVAMLAVCQTGNFEVRAEESVLQETAAEEGKSSPENESVPTETEDPNKEKEAEKMDEASKESEKDDKEAVVRESENQNVPIGTEDSDRKEETAETYADEKSDEEPSVQVSDNEKVTTDTNNSDQEEEPVKPKTSASQEPANTETGTDSETKEEIESDSQQFKPADKLQWDKTTNGLAWFVDTNESGVTYEVSLYCDGKLIEKSKSTYESGSYAYNDNWVPLFFFEGMMEESGTYVFEVVAKDVTGNEIVGKVSSVPYTYTKPSEKLSTPQNGSWSSDGIFSCDWTGEEGLDTYSFRVTHQLSFLKCGNRQHLMRLNDMQSTAGIR